MAGRLAPALLLPALMALPGGVLRPEALSEGLDRFRSADPFERNRGESEILRIGATALPSLARELTAPDRAYRFRIEGLFSEILDGLISDLNSEQQALTLDRNELAGLKERQEMAGRRKELKAKLDEWKAKEPDILEKLDGLLALERLEAREKRAANGEAPALDEVAVRELEQLRRSRDAWKKASPELEENARPFLRIGRLEGLGASGGELTELETIRLKELEERVSDREPRVDQLLKRMDEIGLPAYNALLAKGIAAREKVSAFYSELVSKSIEKHEEAIFPAEAAFEPSRYTRGMLWAWIAQKNPKLASTANDLLARHTRLTVQDLNDSQPIVRDRASDELYLLQERGLEALKAEEAQQKNLFLANLLRWRIRPRTYAKTGISFEDYPQLAFREKRQRLFDYSRAAEADAIPTLRAIVRDDQLEPSFNVKLAAAKALSGLRDMSGYNYLIVKHPDLTLKKPEVSRELLLIEALEHIRDKSYLRAIEDLQKILDDFPFDFQANYQIAFAYLLIKNYAKSIHHFEISRRINPQDQLTLYNLSCAYALAGGKSQEALEALEASVKAGFDDAEHIQKDQDLDSLRDEPRYRQLLESLESGAKR